MHSLLNRHRLYQLWFVSFCALLVVLFFVTRSIGANVQAAAIAQGFKTDETGVAEGALMSLKPGDAGKVEFANLERAEQLIGVIGEKPLIQFSDDANSVQIVTGGVTPVLVSNLEGDIVTGDKITVSPINGVGMKAGESGMVVGTAQADFKDMETTEHFITDVDGKVHTIRTGLLPAQINVTFFAAVGERSNYLPAFLQDIANTVAGRQVSSARILIALIVLLVSFISIAVLLYASVKSSIVSIGRNPLSEGSVRKGLLQIGLTVIGILLFTLITIYLVLTT
jgi:hypothetical protein